MKDPDGNVTTYTYDSNTDALLSTNGKTTNTGVSQAVTNNYTYNNDMLQSIKHNGFSYNFTYDEFGRALSTKVGTQALNTNTYNDKGLLTKSTYGNGDYVDTVYNSLDLITAKKYNGVTKYQWQYNTDSTVNKYIDLANNVTYRYEYDLAGRVRRVYGSDGYKQRNLYDTKGNIYNTLYTFSNNSYIKKYSNNYVYGEDNRINQVRFNQTGINLNRTYDDLGRVTQKSYSLWDEKPFFSTDYTFLAGANGNATGMLSSISNNGETISYTYDNRGNIITVSEGGKQKVKYTYDELNQLIREDSVYLNKTVTYTYDIGGNLTAKKEYAYTTGALGAVTKTIGYTYGDSNWKDKLTAYNGKPVTYDQIGNPLTYDGYTFAWTGRQLDSVSGNGKTVSYKYNANGIRTEKTVNGVKTKYFIEGDRIVLEKVGNEERAFWYDANGQAAAFAIYDAAGMHPYYYIRNGQGDVIGLFDSNGNIVARYSYDSWGKLLKITDGNGVDKTNDTDFIGYKNPIRYRGYYYDTETKLYYLQSRYYNPEWGRFINADAIVVGTLIGTNVFAYCENNPIVRQDPTGNLYRVSYLDEVWYDVYGHARMDDPSDPRFIYDISPQEKEETISGGGAEPGTPCTIRSPEERNSRLYKQKNIAEKIYNFCQDPFFDDGCGLLIKNVVKNGASTALEGAIGGLIEGVKLAPETGGKAIPILIIIGLKGGWYTGVVGGIIETAHEVLFD